MRAARYDRTGGPEVLEIVEVPDPEPAPGEVRVRVRRSGVNPTDWKSRQGAGDGAPVEPAQIPNQDGAGVIDAVGPGVDAGLVGRRVWIWEAAYQRPGGTAAELTCVPVHQAVELPAGLTDVAVYDLGAATAIPFMTAHRALTVAEGGPTQLAPGALTDRNVLVTGGAGAVGNAAIQLARWAGATVFTTVSSPEKAHLAAAAGADHVIDYLRQDVVAEIRGIAPRGIDIVVEVNAAANVETTVQVLAPHASVAVYAQDGDATHTTLPIRPSMVTNARWQFVLVYTEPHAAKLAAVDAIRAAMADGEIGVGEARGLPLHHVALDQIADAHRAVQGGAVGKVLVDLPD